jgi:hypothetical protein
MQAFSRLEEGKRKRRKVAGKRPGEVMPITAFAQRQGNGRRSGAGGMSIKLENESRAGRSKAAALFVAQPNSSVVMP